MSAKIIDGKLAAAEIKKQVRQEVQAMKSSGVTPGLATLLVGDNPASQIYVKNKHKACAEADIASFNHLLPADTDTETVIKKIDELNSYPEVHGILVQLPLPDQVDADKILARVDPRKDVDGFHTHNVGRLFSAKDIREITQARDLIPIPCTPNGIIDLIKKTGVQIAGKNAVVVGRSMIVGKPTAALLLAHHATVTIAHSRTKDLAGECRRADILVAAIGRARMITGDMIKEGAIVIDVGMNRDSQGKLCGDVDFESAKEKAGWITPVPGGVGPMTIAMLLKNTLQLAKNQDKRG